MPGIAAMIRSQDETAGSMALIRWHNQFTVTPPYQADSIGKQRIRIGYPPVHSCRIDPFAIVDFLHLQHQRAIKKVLIDHAMFIAGARRSRQLEQRLQRSIHNYTQLLTDLATGAVQIIFTTVHMAGGRRIPFTRLLILAHGALLQEQLPPAVKQQNVYGAMHQSLGVNISATLYRNDFIIVVDDIEQFMTY